MMDDSDLFMELIRDVANELDIDVLCHKILVNVGLLTHADRGSLFLARGPRDARYLVAKLFDVTVDTGEMKTKCSSTLCFGKKMWTWHVDSRWHTSRLTSKYHVSGSHQKFYSGLEEIRVNCL